MEGGLCWGALRFFPQGKRDCSSGAGGGRFCLAALGGKSTLRGGARKSGNEKTAFPPQKKQGGNKLGTMD